VISKLRTTAKQSSGVEGNFVMNDDGRLAGNRASVTKFYAFNFNQGNRLQLVGADLRQLVSEENQGCWPGQQLFGS